MALLFKKDLHENQLHEKLRTESFGLTRDRRRQTRTDNQRMHSGINNMQECSRLRCTSRSTLRQVCITQTST